MTETEILFVYGDDPASKKQARQHASKVVRRREQQQRTEPRFIFEGTPRKLGAHPEVTKAVESLAMRPSCRITPALDRRNTTRGKIHKAKLGSVAVKLRSRHHPKRATSSVVVARAHCSSGPIDPYFSAARSDPFFTLPVKFDDETAKVLDHFNTSMPYLEFDVHEGAPLIPSRHVAFRSALETPAALHAIIATGATHLASLYGLDTSRIAQKHIGASLGLLKKGLSQLTKRSWNGVAQAIAELAAGDDFREQYQSSRLHLNGLRELMTLIGGLEILKDTPRVQLLMCYVLNSCTAPYFSVMRLSWLRYDRLRELWRNADLFQDLDLPLGQKKSMIDLRHHVRDFVTVMTKISASRNDSVSSTSDTLLICRKILLPQYFPPHDKLLSQLSVSALDSQHFGGLGPKGHHRVSCLFTIILQIFRLCEAGDLQAVALYLEKLQHFHHPNPRLLQFLLLQDGSTVKMYDAKSSWEVVRLMQVYKILNEDWTKKANQALVGFLSGDAADAADTKPFIVSGTKWPMDDIMAVAMKSVIISLDEDT